MGSKPVSAWAVFEPGGSILYQTIKPTLHDAIFVIAAPGEWEFFEQRGYRAVRVTVTEEEKPS